VDENFRREDYSRISSSQLSGPSETSGYSQIPDSSQSLSQVSQLSQVQTPTPRPTLRSRPSFIWDEDIIPDSQDLASSSSYKSSDPPSASTAHIPQSTADTRNFVVDSDHLITQPTSSRKEGVDSSEVGERPAQPSNRQISASGARPPAEVDVEISPPTQEISSSNNIVDYSEAEGLVESLSNHTSTTYREEHSEPGTPQQTESIWEHAQRTQNLVDLISGEAQNEPEEPNNSSIVPQTASPKIATRPTNSAPVDTSPAGIATSLFEDPDPFIPSTQHSLVDLDQESVQFLTQESFRPKEQLEEGTHTQEQSQEQVHTEVREPSPIQVDISIPEPPSSNQIEEQDIDQGEEQEIASVISGERSKVQEISEEQIPINVDNPTEQTSKELTEMSV